MTDFAGEVLSGERNGAEIETDDMEGCRARAEFYVRRHQDNPLDATLEANRPLTGKDVSGLKKFRGAIRAYCGNMRRGSGAGRRGVPGDHRHGHEKRQSCFSEYPQDVDLGSRQIYFVGQIVENIVPNEVMKDLAALQEPPFTDKGSAAGVFTDLSVWLKIRNTIDRISANVVPARTWHMRAKTGKRSVTYPAFTGTPDIFIGHDAPDACLPPNRGAVGMILS